MKRFLNLIEQLSRKETVPGEGITSRKKTVTLVLAPIVTTAWDRDCRSWWVFPELFKIFLKGLIQLVLVWYSV